MINADELLSAIETEIEPRLYLPDFKRGEFGEGYNCCGCSTYGQIVEDVVAIINRLTVPSPPSSS